MFVGGIEYTSEGPDYAVISSGDSYFYLTEKVYQAVVNQFFSTCNQTSSGPSCDCSQTASWPVFSIMFAGA
jgi:hypothetical protein